MQKPTQKFSKNKKHTISYYFFVPQCLVTLRYSFRQIYIITKLYLQVYITIEAVDENGTRIETDTVFVEKLNSGQDINLTAFEYVNEEKIEQLKNATFKVLDVEKYSF